MDRDTMDRTAVETLEGQHLDGIDPRDYARRYLILATMCLSLVLIVATVSSVNVAIPSMAGGLSPTPSDTEILWIVDSYALVFGAFLLPAGAIGDRFGRKGALLAGLALFAVMSALCAMTDSPTTLIACRAVMGLGAAMIMPSTLSLLQSAFPPAERAKAIAIWAGFAGAGGALGPLMGGLLLERYWFGSVFLIAVPIAAVAFVVSALVAPRSKEAGRVALDPGGSALSIVGFSALLMAIIEGPERGWTDWLVVSGFVVAATALTGFVAYERRISAPLLDMRYFRSRRFSSGSIGITLAFLGLFAMFFVLTQYLQYVRGYSALDAAVHQLPLPITTIFASAPAAALAGRIGARKVVLPGLALMSGGLLMLSSAGLDTSYAVVFAGLVTIGIGMAMALPSLSTSIVQSVPMNKAGVGSAVNDTTREIGGAVGIAAIGSVVTSVYRDRLDSVLEGLPAEQADRASDNVAKALGVAEEIRSPELADAVRSAFVDGTQIGLRVAAAIVAVALIALVFRLPDQAGDERSSSAHA